MIILALSRISVILVLFGILLALNPASIGLNDRSGTVPVLADIQTGTEYLVAYSENAYISTTGTFQLYVGVFEEVQGFIGGKYIEYYHTDAPQLIENVTTNSGELTIITWDASSWSGIETINITYGSQTVSVKVNAYDLITSGSGIASINYDFENDNPTLGADNNVSLDFWNLESPLNFIVEGTELISIETTAVINSQTHNLVLGFTQTTFGFYNDPIHMSIPFITPVWAQAGGSLPINIEFSGNTLYAPKTIMDSLPISNGGQSLDISFPGGYAGGDRSNFGETTNTIDLQVDLSGNNPDGTTLDVKLQISGYPDETLISNYSLTGFSSVIPFTIPYTSGLGTGNLIAEITKDSVIQDQKVVNFTVFEEITVLIDFSSEILSPNESVDILIYTYQEDTYLPESTNVVIYDDPGLTNPIINITTDVNGQKLVNYIVPNLNNGGTQNWWIVIQPIGNSTYQGQTIIWPVNIFAETQIDANNEIFILNRGEETTLTAQVSTDSGVVTDGILVLVSEDTETNIAQFDLSNSSQADYLLEIDQDFPKGISYLRWDYIGTDVLSPAQQSIAVYVYSQPVFQDTTINQTYALPGQSVLFHGDLVQDDSLNSALDGATTIELWHINTSGSFLVNSFDTEDTGEFSYEYLIPSDTAVGIYSYQLRFSGDESLFLRPSQNQPFLELEIRAERALTWEVPSETGYVLSGDSLNTTVFGRSGLTYEIHYSTEDLLKTNTWVLLGEIALVGVDQQDIVINLPDISNAITLRLLEVETDIYEFYPLTLYTQPMVDITFPEEVIQTYEDATITISSSESFKLRLNDNYLNSGVEYPAGDLIWNYTFLNAGEHTIYVEAIGTNLAQDIFEFEIIIYESVNVEWLNPIETEVLIGSEQVFTFRVTDGNNDPMFNVQVELISSIDNITGFTGDQLPFATGYTSITGEATIQAYVTNQFFAVRLSEDSDRFIQLQIQEIIIPIEQLLEIETNLDGFEIAVGESGAINIQVNFQYSNESPENVSLLIMITHQTDPNVIPMEIYVNTSENGNVILNVGKNLDPGDYWVKIISQDTRYRPYEITQTLRVTNTPTLLDQVMGFLWVLPVIGTGVIGVATAGQKVRTKIKS